MGDDGVYEIVNNGFALGIRNVCSQSQSRLDYVFSVGLADLVDQSTKIRTLKHVLKWMPNDLAANHRYSQFVIVRFDAKRGSAQHQYRLRGVSDYFA